ncbi:MFS transporter [uncultured Sphingomonas sp.]|uniref:MFS transporter n=1 Tax=uncultured Sphingomonas sp. TaxID=158754 RepID=UPI00262FD23E|nr:MFS transporter [uncultured Sphingomonas sp.]
MSKFAAGHRADPDIGPDFDIGRAIDAGRWSGYQKLVLLLVGCAVIFDGFDNQSLGFAAPAIIRDWGISKEMLSPVMAIGQFGMMFGAALGGMIGDRFGRKAALVGSVLTFGVLTGCIAFSNSLFVIGALRLVANIGLGAAFPNAAALVSEYTPARNRSLGVTASIVCVPLGGVVGGLIAAQVLPIFGWRMLFAAAGGATLTVALLLFLCLPESTRFLLRRHGDTPKLRRLLARVGLDVPANARLVDIAEQDEGQHGKSPLAALFSGAWRRDTIALWAAFGACLFAVYTAFSWLPTMLSDAGFDLAFSSQGLTAFNIGGVIAALTGAWLIGHKGSKAPMVVMAIGGVLGAGVLLTNPLDPAGSRLVLILILGIEGAFINGVQTTLYALAANVYPTAIRATGVGSATSVGRIGAIASSFGGALALHALGASGLSLMLLVAMGATAIALMSVRRHFQPAHSNGV